MSPRGPSGASKSLFKNLKKHLVFTRFWVQRPPKKTSRKKTCKKQHEKKAEKTKKMLKECLLGKKCLKPAISFFPFLGPKFGGQICTFLSSFFNILLLTFRRTFGTHFGAHSWTRSAQERPRWTQEDHQELQRAKKLHFHKSGFRVGHSTFFRS